MDMRYHNPETINRSIDNHRRFVLPVEWPVRQPLAAETIGINPAQENIARMNGYPCFHWLQSLSGEGRAHFAGRTVAMPPNTGLLLFPGDPHGYESVGGVWRTAYVTFAGTLAAELLAGLGMPSSVLVRLPPEAGLEPFLLETMEQLERHGDPFGVATSSAVYRLIVTLARYGETGVRPRRQTGRIRQLQAAIDWMEAHVADPDAGVSQLASSLGLSERRLNGLFRESFGQSPYACLIQLRIRRAKEWLHADPDLPIREIAAKAGFRDVSHFTATFRKQVGMPPAAYRHNR